MLEMAHPVLRAIMDHIAHDRKVTFIPKLHDRMMIIQIEDKVGNLAQDFIGDKVLRGGSPVTPELWVAGTLVRLGEKLK